MMTEKKPWLEVPEIWKTEAAYWTWMKGVFRKGWNHHPIKIEYIKKYRKMVPNPNPKGSKKMVWGMTCAICNKDYVQSNIQIDHRHGSTKLTEQSHIQACVEHLLMVTFDDLRALCKKCHEVVSYKDKHNISFERALIEKETIAFKKLYAEEQRIVLLTCYTPDIVKTLATGVMRVNAYREYLERKANEKA
jgi:hypothetical protein